MSGYALEQCLSVDNLFVFLVLFDYFKVDLDRQDKVLSYGIWGAVILRGVFIAAGSVALSEFHQVLLGFAAVLFFSSYKILSKGDEEDEVSSQSYHLNRTAVRASRLHPHRLPV
jgi:tellurite resistance protein TerC